MKTTKFLLIVYIIIFLSPKVEAQNSLKNITGGLKAEANLFNFLIGKTSKVESLPHVGGTFGGFVYFGLKKNFALQVELLFDYKSSTLQRENINGTFHYWGMAVPLYVLYHLDFKQAGRLYFGLGTAGNFGLSAVLKRNDETIDLYKKDDETKLSAMLDFYSTVNALIGYELPFGLQINVGYNIAVTNVLDNNSSALKLIPSTFSIGVAYKFHKLTKKIAALEIDE